jgi:5-methylcytosine-specific restriction protein B
MLIDIADRSLSMVDLALRRRFAFIDLKPEIGLKWQKWLIDNCGMDAEFVSGVQERMIRLNNKIEQDVRLGKQFKIGHSYVTPSDGQQIRNANTWFKQIIETELAPLLDEYWFDAPTEVKDALAILMQDI